jgi:hypothetical protein
LAGAPELPSTTSMETRRGRGGLEKRKAKKVEKQQNKGGGADLMASRGAEEAGEQRRQPDLAPLARVAATRPSPPSPSSIPITGHRRGRRKVAGIGSGGTGVRGGPPRI